MILRRRLERMRRGPTSGWVRLGSGLRQLFEPFQCPGCSHRVDRPGLCRQCGAAVADLPSPVWRTIEIAGGPPLPVVAVAPYERPWRDVILHLKEDPDVVVQEAVCERLDSLGPALPDLGGFVIAPIPSAPVRLRERGFNPPEVLARWIAEARSGEVRPHLLERRAYQGPLQGLGADERGERLRGAMGPGPELRHSRSAAPGVVLVDDVLTTGSTLAAATRTLREAGIDELLGVVLASAELGRNSV